MLPKLQDEKVPSGTLFPCSPLNSLLNAALSLDYDLAVFFLRPLRCEAKTLMLVTKVRKSKFREFGCVVVLKMSAVALPDCLGGKKGERPGSLFRPLSSRVSVC